MGHLFLENRDQYHVDSSVTQSISSPGRQVQECMTEGALRMSQLILSEACVFSLGMVVLAWVSHRRFTQKVADTAPALLAGTGLLASLLAIALAQFSTEQFHGDLFAPRWELGAAFLTSAVGLACALSIKGRYALLGIPTALAIDPGPSNRDLLSALDRQFSLLEQDRQTLR